MIDGSPLVRLAVLQRDLGGAIRADACLAIFCRLEIRWRTNIDDRVGPWFKVIKGRQAIVLAVIAITGLRDRLRPLFEGETGPWEGIASPVGGGHDE